MHETERSQPTRPNPPVYPTFADLRKRDDYRRNIAALLKVQRDRDIERVIQVQRRHRVNGRAD
jgi:hypothetical protein